MDFDDIYMGLALEQADKAFNADEVPIGCVIVYNNEVIGKGYNRRISAKNTLAHAEIIAINEACGVIGDWRLEDCSLYVTVEPCPMCAGAILQARIKEIIFGAANPKAGCCGSILNIVDDDRFNHQVIVRQGVRGEECASKMREFFRHRRDKA